MQGTREVHPPTTPEPLLRSLRGKGAAALLTRMAGPPGLAAFDADGTLWDGDLGEAVLLALIREGQLLAAPPDPWNEYVARVNRDPADGFGYAGRLMAGLSEELIRGTSARVFAAEFSAKVFPECRWLLQTLAQSGWVIYLVSASNRWSIEIAADSFGLPRERVLALDLDSDQGILTDRVCSPVPTLEGKPALLRARTDRFPDLAFGNSFLDLPLLLSATVPVAVGLLRDASQGNPQNAFLVEATRRGWARLEIPAT
jgi:phosphoserine phosphatase